MRKSIGLLLAMLLVFSSALSAHGYSVPSKKYSDACRQAYIDIINGRFHAALQKLQIAQDILSRLKRQQLSRWGYHREHICNCLISFALAKLTTKVGRTEQNLLLLKLLKGTYNEGGNSARFDACIALAHAHFKGNHDSFKKLIKTKTHTGWFGFRNVDTDFQKAALREFEQSSSESHYTFFSPILGDVLFDIKKGLLSPIERKRLLMASLYKGMPVTEVFKLIGEPDVTINNTLFYGVNNKRTIARIGIIKTINNSVYESLCSDMRYMGRMRFSLYSIMFNLKHPLAPKSPDEPLPCPPGISVAFKSLKRNSPKNKLHTNPTATYIIENDTSGFIQLNWCCFSRGSLQHFYDSDMNHAFTAVQCPSGRKCENSKLVSIPQNGKMENTIKINETAFLKVCLRPPRKYYFRLMVSAHKLEAIQSNIIHIPSKSAQITNSN